MGPDEGCCCKTWTHLNGALVQSWQVSCKFQIVLQKFTLKCLLLFLIFACDW